MTDREYAFPHASIRNARHRGSALCATPRFARRAGDCKSLARRVSGPVTPHHIALCPAPQTGTAFAVRLAGGNSIVP